MMFYFSATIAPQSNIKEVECQQILYYISRCFKHFAFISQIRNDKYHIVYHYRMFLCMTYSGVMMPQLIHITSDHEHHCMTLKLLNTIYFQRMPVCVRVCRTDERHFLSQKSINNWQTAVGPHFSLCLLLSLIRGCGPANPAARREGD